MSAIYFNKSRLLVYIILLGIVSIYFFEPIYATYTNSSVENLDMLSLAIFIIMFVACIIMIILYIKAFLYNKAIISIEEAALVLNYYYNVSLSWECIENAQTILVNRKKQNKIVVIHLKNPSLYLDCEMSGLDSRLRKNNMDLYSSPIVIKTNHLDISAEKIEALINEKSKAFNNTLA